MFTDNGNQWAVARYGTVRARFWSAAWSRHRLCTFKLGRLPLHSCLSSCQPLRLHTLRSLFSFKVLPRRLVVRRQAVVFYTQILNDELCRVGLKEATAGMATVTLTFQRGSIDDRGATLG